MTPLRQQMIDQMTVRGMAETTKKAYLQAVTGLAKYYRRSPDQINEQEVQQYLLHLIEERRLAWSSCNVATNGLKFLYHVTLDRREVEFCIPQAKRPQRLPEILGREEIESLLAAAREPKHRTLLMLTYSAGLRVSEVAHLKVRDIDSGHMSVRVEQGKGNKDRYTVLSTRMLKELRSYWLAYRPEVWLFTGRDRTRPMHVKTIQRVFYLAKERAGIGKTCGIHALRHAFATHLLEAGTDLHTIQRLLGHGHLSTTMRYFHLAQKHLLSAGSPLDLLRLPTAQF
jgi:integrase/recombinase XerD